MTIRIPYSGIAAIGIYSFFLIRIFGQVTIHFIVDKRHTFSSLEFCYNFVSSINHMQMRIEMLGDYLANKRNRRFTYLKIKGILLDRRHVAWGD
jgi:hypothetical protein